MAETLFTQLPVATSLTGTEVIPLDQPNAAPPGTYTTKRATAQQIANLAPSSALIVNLQTGTSYVTPATDKAALVSFSNASPVAVTLPAVGNAPTQANSAWFVQYENRGAGLVTISPAGAQTIDGAATMTLTQDQGVVIALASDGNWYTQRGRGLTAATAVTSVGLAAPGIFTVSGSPVITTGTLTLTLATQAANIVWAGPSSGADAAPTFRALVTNDLPDAGTAGTYGSGSLVPVITTDAKGRVTSVTTSAVNFGTIAATTLLGNPTGGVAAASAITLGATLSFSGSSLQTGAATGDVTWTANSFATTIASNAVTVGKMAQLAGLSVLGNGTNATANMAALTAASDGQVLRRSGTAVAFGALSLSTAAAVTGTLAATNGGTGNATFVVGDILYASTTSALSRLADVAVDNALISGGVGGAPAWGKVTLAAQANVSTGVIMGRTTAGTGVQEALTPTQARSVSGTPAIPISGAGVGQMLAINPGDNVAWTLPAGGTWSYAFFGYNTTTGVVASATRAGTAAGGTAVDVATPNLSWTGWAWRVS